MERGRVHEQTHTSQPTPFQTHPTSYAHTTYRPTSTHTSQDFSFEDEQLPMHPDGRVKLPSDQPPNTATLSHICRESTHRVTNKTGASKGIKNLSLPKTGGSSEPLQKGSQTLNVANDFSGPLVSRTETDHFGHLKEKIKKSSTNLNSGSASSGHQLVETMGENQHVECDRATGNGRDDKKGGSEKIENF